MLLRKQLAELNKNPVEGFSAGLIDDEDIFRWEVSALQSPSPARARAVTIRVVGYDNWSSRHSLRRRILQVSSVFPHRVSSQTSCVKVSLSQSPASICCSGLQYNEGLRSLIKALKSPTGNYPETNHLPQTEFVFEAGSS